jgi:murein DD-endopeptidase MepM/ murein hydrolase activator NlpD
MARDDNYLSFVISKTDTDASRSRLRRVTIHRNWLYALAGFGVCLVIAIAIGVYGLTQRALHQQTAVENEQLRDQNDLNRQQFQELNKRLNAAEEKSRQIAEMAATANSNSAAATPANNANANQNHADFNGSGGPGWPLDWDAPKNGDDENITPEELAQRVALLEKKLRDYEAIIRQQAVRPSIWPVTGRLTDFYGPRRNPFGGGGEFHPGQDIANAVGTPVIATANGKVIYANWQNGYGRLIEIEHGNGITTRYAHLSKLEVVEGQEITRGQLIGLLGSSGRSTGPHVHYEVRINNETVNPLDYLPREAWVEAEMKK